MKKNICLKCRGTGFIGWDRINTFQETERVPIYKKIRCDECNGIGKILLPKEGIPIGEVKS